jgi:DNA-binding PadR family transcriptional regulator
MTVYYHARDVYLRLAMSVSDIGRAPPWVLAAKPDMHPKIVTREILLGFWKAHILYHAAEGPVVGQWMIQELRRHGYEVSPGTMYPLLSRMQRNGWLRSRVIGQGPRARREYRLTRDGAAVLRLVRRQLGELNHEVREHSDGNPANPTRGRGVSGREQR